MDARHLTPRAFDVGRLARFGAAAVLTAANLFVLLGLAVGASMFWRVSAFTVRESIDYMRTPARAAVVPAPAKHAAVRRRPAPAARRAVRRVKV